MAPQQSKTLTVAGGAIRTNRKPKAKAEPVTSNRKFVDAGEFDVTKLTWLPPRTIKGGDTAFAFATYDDKPFHLIIGGARVTGKISEYEKPTGGSKHSFGISIGDLGAVGALALCDSVTQLENHPNLATFVNGLELGKVHTPLWGDDKPALNLEVDPAKVVVLDGTLEDIMGGAVVKVAINPSIWMREEEDEDGNKTGVMNVGLKFKAASVRILEKRDTSEVDWNASYRPEIFRIGQSRVTCKYPYLALKSVIKHSDLETRLNLNKAGIPLSYCLKGIGWPQNRYELPSALMKPRPEKVDGCAMCGYALTTCGCVLRAYDVIGDERTLIKNCGYPDYDGKIWPRYDQSMEQSFNEEWYLIEHWSNDWEEWSVATALNGERVAWQLRSSRNERVSYWHPMDPKCYCGFFVNSAPEHEAWDRCINPAMPVRIPDNPVQPIHIVFG